MATRTPLRPRGSGPCGWAVVHSVAAVASILAATLAGALHHFVGVSLLPMVVVTAVVGLWIGWRLPLGGGRNLAP